MNICCLPAHLPLPCEHSQLRPDWSIRWCCALCFAKRSLGAKKNTALTPFRITLEKNKNHSQSPIIRAEGIFRVKLFKSFVSILAAFPFNHGHLVLSFALIATISYPGLLPAHSRHSSPSGHLTHSRSSSKGSVEEMMSQPKQKELVGSVRQKMLLDYSVYMGRCVPQDDRSPHRSPVQSAEGSPTAGKKVKKKKKSPGLFCSS